MAIEAAASKADIIPNSVPTVWLQMPWRSQQPQHHRLVLLQSIEEATVASASMADGIKKNHNLLKNLTEVVVGSGLRGRGYHTSSLNVTGHCKKI